MVVRPAGSSNPYATSNRLGIVVRLIYVLLSYLIAPVVVVFLLWRGFFNRAYFDRFGERFGFTRLSFSRPAIWVHAVSVGEVQAAAPLVRELNRKHPDIPIVITTVTPAGAQRAVDLLGDCARHCYAPYDLPGAVARFFDAARPALAIIIETELWPTLYHECGKRQVPLVLASARISPRSVSKYRWFKSLFREALSHGIVIAAQSEKDAERFRLLGAPPERTHVVGNIKFDFELPAAVLTEGRAIRQANAPQRPVWVAASTHHDEEEQMLDAHQRLCRQYPDALLILAPRHPERFGLIATLLRKRGVSFITRSSGMSCTPETSVFLLDTLGELPVFYAASDVAFVAGSLVPIGGHNLLEPAALGIPVLTGPHTFNAEDIAEMLAAVGAMREVKNSVELAAQLASLIADPEARRYAGAQGRKTVQENRGAVARLLTLLDPLIPRDRLPETANRPARNSLR